MTFKFALGQHVKDTVSPFTGIVTSRAEYLWGCVTYGVQSDVLKDGSPQNAEWLDEDRLEVVESEKAVQASTTAPTGGPVRVVPSPTR